ncbi:hypothetical protein VE03_10215, partial [Pseudogymnoascus sp. 23342-1-I1]
MVKETRELSDSETVVARKTSLYKPSGKAKEAFADGTFVMHVVASLEAFWRRPK